MIKGLNLGCGFAAYPSKGDETWINLDKMARPSDWGDGDTYYRFDLEDPARGHKLSFPDNFFDVVVARHVLEHVSGLLPLVEELHRVLRPGGHLLARVPYAQSVGAFEDPTHVRYFVPSTFLSFTQEYYWRADYNYRADFDVVRSIVFVPEEYKRLAEDELNHGVNHLFNIGQEIFSVLRAVKPIRKPSGNLPSMDTEVRFFGDQRIEQELVELIYPKKDDPKVCRESGRPDS